jgi:hypothetical protein
VQVEKPNLDIRFDEETLYHLITRMKMRGQRKLDAAELVGLVFNVHLSNNTNIVVISETCNLRRLRECVCTHVTNFFFFLKCVIVIPTT